MDDTVPRTTHETNRIEAPVTIARELLEKQQSIFYIFKRQVYDFCNPYVTLTSQLFQLYSYISNYQPQPMQSVT